MEFEKRIIVIGLGSMGKRRIRNLFALGYRNIFGFDIRDDRCLSTSEYYGITLISSIGEVISKKFDAWIISTPPDTHHLYMFMALENKIPSFIEASVVDTGLKEIIEQSVNYQVLLAPSCTLYFHPGIKLITKIIESCQIGNITNILYHSGQFLPDWHSYEDVSEFYVSNNNVILSRGINDVISSKYFKKVVNRSKEGFSGQNLNK